ncbi:MAG: universal stress protein [Devosia sp.]
MTYECFLPVATFPDAASNAALSHGMAIATRLGVSFHAAIHEVEMMPVSTMLAGLAVNVTAMSERAEADSKKAAKELAIWLKEQAAALKTPISIQAVNCPAEALIDQWLAPARTSDFTLVTAPQTEQQQAMVIDLIFGIGGPVLLVPDTATPDTKNAFGVSIAWDGSRAASRAVRDAMPFLSAATDVSIIVIDDDKAIEGKSASALRHWLSQRGIAARLLTRSRGTVPVGDTLQAAALAAGADILVMGAYGHSRIREMVLGGATRSILEHARLPILTTH